MKTTATIDHVMDALKQDGRVIVLGFGTFTVKHREARKGRNPATGQPVDIPASKTVGFKPSPTFRTSLAE